MWRIGNHVTVWTVYYDTWVSIVKIWLRSGTFAHGFLIIPISLWLIWIRRTDYKNLQPQIKLAGYFVVLGCGLIWLLLGNQVTFKMMMPLGFLFLVVGETCGHA